MKQDNVTVLSYALMDNICILFISGQANFSICFTLKKFLESWCRQKNGTLFIDIENCTFMDSTFMGLLAGLTLKVKDDDSHRIKIINPDNIVHQSMSALGLNKIIDITECNISVDLPRKMIPIITETNHEKSIRMVLDSHLKLMDISDENKGKFRTLIETLNKSLSSKN